MQFRQTQFVPYTAEQMFNLVADVESYSDFIPWCKNTTIISNEPLHIQLTLSYLKNKILFTTHNINNYPNTINIQLVEGPFKSLNGQWQFLTRDNGCQIIFTLNISLSNFFLDKAIQVLINHIGADITSSFAKRAKIVYNY